jgi:predicted ABC-type ATPase
LKAKLPAGASAIYNRRPIVIALAGPNGAGKSTFYEAQLAEMKLQFVNADILAQTAAIGPYEAAAMADAVRRQLVLSRESFVFETVFSDPVGDKLDFLLSVENSGYTVLLIFIGIDSSSLSDDRVAIRVSQGGHDVPTNKLVERFPRILPNLKRALVELSNVHVYDNSNLDDKYRRVAWKEDGGKVVLYGPTPEWLRPLLPKKIKPVPFTLKE